MSNKISLILFTAIVLLLVISTGYTVYTNHKRNLFKVVEQKIEDAAKECNIKKECTDEFTLALLIQLGYIESQVHPITKEFINEDTTIHCIDYSCDVSIQ